MMHVLVRVPAALGGGTALGQRVRRVEAKVPPIYRNSGGKCVQTVETGEIAIIFYAEKI